MAGIRWAVISLIAMADVEYGLTLPPKRIAECETAEELAVLVESHQSEASAK